VHKQPSEYLSLRHEFEPKDVKLAIVAESPPISGKYFYDPCSNVSEPVFSALISKLNSHANLHRSPLELNKR
jgi:hypothetical protein